MPTHRSCSRCGRALCRLCVQGMSRASECSNCAHAQTDAPSEARAIWIVQAQMGLLAVLTLAFFVWSLTWRTAARPAIQRPTVPVDTAPFQPVAPVLGQVQLPSSPDLDLLPVVPEIDTTSKPAEPEPIFEPSSLDKAEKLVVAPRPKSPIPTPVKEPKVTRKPLDLAARFHTGNRLYRYNIDEIPGADKTIVLTFDGDQMANCVYQLLAILEEKKVRANIFLTGYFVQTFPQETLAIVQAGHEVGNHTYGHPRLTSYEQTRTQKTLENVDAAFLNDELTRTETVYEQLVGHSLSPFWRAPYGEHNAQIRSWAYAQGYLHVGWSSGYDSMDWFTNQQSKYYWRPEALRLRLLNKLDNNPEPGKILLFHLGSKRPDADQPYHMLAQFIDDSRQRGFSFTTIAELLDGNLGVTVPSTQAQMPPVPARKSH
ncbi:MAG: polysaccharide deacetylase family protein [Acidobacteria bacterium]|nr:polysaccharide deacetylase family protein [Acidobacteriota bacterium]